jgi:diguanylate cyclase (GGDEF)-like protein
VCRYGGDEFIVIVEDIKNHEHLHTIKDAIYAAISEPIHLDEKNILYPHASIGIALYPDNAIDAEELIKAADMSMYEDKKNKKLSAQEPVLCVDNHSR